MTDKMIEVPSEDQIYEASKGWREYDANMQWTTEERILRCAARCIHQALLRAPAKEAVTPDNRVSVDRGALKMAENVLRRAGKDEVADALMQSCGQTAAHTDNEGDPLDEAVRKSWSRYCNAFAKSPDAPYPGMIESFERHYSQDFRDPEWRSEAGTWAAAWKSAIATTSNPDDRKPGDGEPITPAELAKLMRNNPDLRFAVDNKPDDLEAMRRDAELLDFVLEQDAFLFRNTTDAGVTVFQLWTQDEDENYHVLSGEGQFFKTPRDAIRAAIAAEKGEEK